MTKFKLLFLALGCVLQRILTEFSREGRANLERCCANSFGYGCTWVANLRTSNIKNRCTFQKTKLCAFD